MNLNEKVYLGDSVYAVFDGYSVVLTTENGFGPSNTIILDPEVIEHLNLYWNRIMEMAAQVREDGKP